MSKITPSAISVAAVHHRAAMADVKLAVELEKFNQCPISMRPPCHEHVGTDDRGSVRESV